MKKRPLTDPRGDRPESPNFKLGKFKTVYICDCRDIEITDENGKTTRLDGKFELRRVILENDEEEKQ